MYRPAPTPSAPPAHTQPLRPDHRTLDPRKGTAYVPLIPEKMGSKEDWIERAHCSACSRSIDDLFGTDKKQRKVQLLKEEMFEQIYEAVGTEIAPEDLVSALVVRNAKFHPVTACVLAVMTLGIFCIFRPRDDDAIIVLTRQERVLLAKDERPSFCSGQAVPAVLTFLRYLIGLLLILSLPSIFFIIAFRRWGTHAMSEEELQFILNVQWDLEKSVIARLQRNSVLVACIGVVGFTALLFWLWINSPQDYGTRVRQSHAASTVCGGQLSLTGSEYRRRGILRLYFGKFPPQSQLDSQMRLRSGEVVAPVRRDDLTSSGLFRGATLGSGNTTPAAIIAFTIMLSVVTLLDSSFAWIDRSWALAKVATMSEFCIHAPTDPLTGPDYCTRRACEDWARTHPDLSLDLCKEVQWYDILDTDANLFCEMYGHPSPPCCGGCIAGGAMNYFNNGLDAFKGILGVLADIGTLVFSFIAARSVMTLVKARDVVDMTFVRTPSFRSQTSNTEFTQPLAALFMERVFQMARDKLGDDGPGPQGAEESGKKWGNGIKDFEINDESKDWDDFFSSDNLVLPGASRWSPKVNIPWHCLGLLNGEQVLAAWTETPQVTLVHILPNALGAVLLLFALLFWPTRSESDAFILPGFGEGFGARGLSALTASGIFFIVTMAVLQLCILRSVQHVVIVTNQRIFYVRYRGKCWLLLIFGLDLRVDTFRHDRDVFFGRMNSTNLSIFQRLMRVRWVPGEVFMQVKFGVLRLSRARGDALDIYNVISQLTRKPDFLKRAQIEEAGVNWEQCQNWVEDALIRRGSEVWTLNGQEDDFNGHNPELFLSCATEKPIFHWSFKETGKLGTTQNTNTDIVVTSGRVLLWSRMLYKRFDCKTSCCLLMGGVCQCAFCNALTKRRLPNSMSFVALSAVMSFTTETTMEPPLWYDPEHPPVKVGCIEEMCEAMTRCMTCDPRGVQCYKGGFDICPRRTGPRAGLSMQWQAKFNAQQPEPDLECSVRPFALPDAASVGLLTAMGLANVGSTRAEQQLQKQNAVRLEVLHKIMGVVQGLTSQS